MAMQRAIAVVAARILRRSYLCRCYVTRSTGPATVMSEGQLPYYQKKGEGKQAILCLPGALGSLHTDFAPQLEHFGRKDSGYTIVGFDPKGYGYSRPPERKFEVDPVSFFTFDAQDAHKVMQHLDIPKYSVLGWSDGGITAVILAALYPDSVNKLVIWGSNAYVSKHDIELFEKVRDTTSWSPRMRRPMEDLYGSDTFQKLWSEWIDAMCALQARRNGDLCVQECLKVMCPTLVVHGAKDAMCPQFHAEYLNKHISNSRLEIFPEGKHNVHLRYREEFNQLVHTFLSE